MNIIIGLIVGLVFFIATVKAYTLGLKHGKQLNNNQIPHVEVNPITYSTKIMDEVKAEMQQKKEEKQADILVDIMEYSRETALNSIKRGEKA